MNDRSDAAATADAFLRGTVGGVAEPRRRARFHSLDVVDVRPLTADSVVVTFGVPAALRGDFDYLAGQHVALRVRLDGKEVRRSYSLCRAPAPSTRSGTTPSIRSGTEEVAEPVEAPTTISIAVKRDVGGLFSTWAQTELHPGDRIDVMSPQGTFTSTLADLDGAHVCAIAAGSGITPLMALADTVLSRSATSRFTLIYTNRSTTDVMFVEDLADLKDRYPARLALHHVLSREQRTAPLLSGRIDEAKLRLLLSALVPPETIDEWFLCGPFDLVQLCRDVLADVGVDRAHVRYELFTSDEPGRAVSAPPHPVVSRRDDASVRIDFTLDGQTSRVVSSASAHETVLAAALRARADVPFACAGGVCGTCRAKLVSGAVQMTQNFALEPEELERGYILTCQSHPTTDAVVVDYDV